MAESNAKKAAAGAPKDGQVDVAGRNAASTANAASGQSAESTQQSRQDSARSADGKVDDTNRIEAAQRQGEDTGSPPNSTDVHNPDPELRADLENDTKTADAEERQRSVREEADHRLREVTETGEDGSKERLDAINYELGRVQEALDEMLRYRDRLRTQYDREIDVQAAAASRPFGELVAQAFASADKEAEEEAALRRRASGR